MRLLAQHECTKRVTLATEDEVPAISGGITLLLVGISLMP